MGASHWYCMSYAKIFLSLSDTTDEELIQREYR